MQLQRRSFDKSRMNECYVFKASCDFALRQSNADPSMRDNGEKNWRVYLNKETAKNDGDISSIRERQQGEREFRNTKTVGRCL
jgi:hypothetical protein